jgi:hypothetical protein
MKNLKEAWVKPGTDYQIRYFRDGDHIIKQISNDTILVYEQILQNYDEFYEAQTCIANGFEAEEVGRFCVIQ